MRPILIFFLFFVVSVRLFAANSEEKTTIDNIHQLCYQLIEEADWDKTIYMADSAIELSLNSQYNWGSANSYFIKAYALNKSGKPSKAVINYFEALRLLESDQEHVSTYVSLHLNLGEIFHRFSSYKQAITIYDKGISIAEKNDLDQKVTRLNFNKAQSLQSDGQIVEAVKTYYDIMATTGTTKDYRHYFKSVTNIGLINLEIDRYDSAIACFTDALNITDHLSMADKHKGQTYHNLAVAHWKAGNKQKAERYFGISQSITALNGSENDQFLLFKDLSEYYYDLGNFDQSMSYSKQALALIGNIPTSLENLSVYRNLSNSALRLNNSESGIYFASLYDEQLDNYLSQKEASLKEQNRYQIDLLTQQYFTNLEKREQQKQIQHLVIALICVVFFFLSLLLIFKLLRARTIRSAEAELKKAFSNLNYDIS